MKASGWNKNGIKEKKINAVEKKRRKEEENKNRKNANERKKKNRKKGGIKREGERDGELLLWVVIVV